MSFYKKKISEFFHCFDTDRDPDQLASHYKTDAKLFHKGKEFEGVEEIVKVIQNFPPCKHTVKKVEGGNVGDVVVLLFTGIVEAEGYPVLPFVATWTLKDDSIVSSTMILNGH